MEMSAKPSHSRKVVLVGDSGVGKTSLILKLTQGSVEFTREPSTIAANSRLHTITLPSGQVVLDIWDTAGQERYRSLAPMTLRNADVGIVCFCPGLNPESRLEISVMKNACTASVRTWIELFRKDSPDTKFLLAATKSDLFPDIQTELQNLADDLTNELQCDANFITSAATGEGVDELFARAAQIVQHAVGQSEGELDTGRGPIRPREDISCC
jgi:small GTP-binding protein